MMSYYGTARLGASQYTGAPGTNDSQFDEYGRRRRRSPFGAVCEWLWNWIYFFFCCLVSGL